jgi:hypothetical protein
MIANPPQWFDVRADAPSPWASVRVSIEAIEWLAQLWAASETHEAMVALWGSFLASEAHFRAQLPNVDLTTRGTSWELIKFLHVAAGVDQGIAGCVPDLPALPRGDRARLYYHGILMVSMGHAYKTGVSTSAAVEWSVMRALSGAVCYAMGPLLAREIRRRGEKHSAGYGAALLELLRRAEHLLPLFGVGEREIADRAARATRSQTARVLKRRGLSYSQIEDFLEGLPGQATETVAKEFGAVDPLVLMGRATEGGLNHAGRAIVFDAADAARPAIRWRELELTFTEEEVGGIAQPGYQDAQDRLQDLRRRAAAADPKLQRYLDAACDGADRKTVAARLGVSTTYVDKCRARLKKLADDLPR